MSRTLRTKCGALESLNVPAARYSCRPKAPQMRQIVVSDSPVSLAVERSDRWVVSVGVAVSVRSITSATFSSLIDSLRAPKPGRAHRSRPHRLVAQSSSGGEYHPSALPKQDVRLSPHPAPTLQPPVARRVATGRTNWGLVAQHVTRPSQCIDARSRRLNRLYFRRAQRPRATFT